MYCITAVLFKLTELAKKGILMPYSSMKKIDRNDNYYSANRCYIKVLDVQKSIWITISLYSNAFNNNYDLYSYLQLVDTSLVSQNITVL
jgi:hypothetical protein